jgi:hypothetical protein
MAEKRLFDPAEKTKTCFVCKQMLPYSAFSPNNKMVSGRASYCRPCAAAKRRDSLKRKADKRPKDLERLAITKQCVICKQLKGGGEFACAPRSKRPDGLTARCAACITMQKECVKAGRQFCTGCLTIKAASAFYHHKTNGKKRSKCIECWRKDTQAYWDSLTLEERRKIGWRAHLNHTRRVNDAQYEFIWESQDGKCAICNEVLTVEPRRPALDHCHTTDKVRGLLCHSCNKGLGHFRDKPEVLERAAEYLRQSEVLPGWVERLDHLAEKKLCVRCLPQT